MNESLLFYYLSAKIKYFTFAVIISTACLCNAGQRLTQEENKLLRELTSNLNRSKDLNESAEIVEKIIDIGPLAAKNVKSRVSSILKKYHKSYLSSYKKAAKKLSPRLKTKEKKEIKNCREVLEELRKKGKSLTKDMIVKDGDPNLKRLKELMTVSHSEIIQSDESLKELRKHLEKFSDLENRCITASGNDTSSKMKASKAPQAEPHSFIEKLTRDEMLTCSKETFVEGRDFSILKKNEKISDSISPKEAMGILDLNLMRILLGISPMKIDIKLCEAARDHSKDMATVGFFAHESPVKGKKTPWDRAKRFHTSANGENIANGNDSPEQTNIQWFHSPGHHINMLNPEFEVVGLGQYQKYWTQMFRR